jgi:hypothetical protein
VGGGPEDGWSEVDERESTDDDSTTLGEGDDDSQAAGATHAPDSGPQPASNRRNPGRGQSVAAGSGIGLCWAGVVVIALAIGDEPVGGSWATLVFVLVAVTLLAVIGTVAAIGTVRAWPLVTPSVLTVIVAATAAVLSGNHGVAAGIAVTAGTVLLWVCALIPARRTSHRVAPAVCVAVAAALIAPTVILTPSLASDDELEVTTTAITDGTATPSGLVPFSADDISYTSGAVVAAQNDRIETDPNRAYSDTREETTFVSRSLRDGRATWRTHFTQKAVAVGVDGVLLVRASDGTAVGLDPASGRELWRRTATSLFEGLSTVSSSPGPDTTGRDTDFSALQVALVGNPARTDIGRADLRTGGLKWRRDLGDCVRTGGSPTVTTTTVSVDLECRTAGSLEPRRDSITFDLATGAPVPPPNTPAPQEQTSTFGGDRVLSPVGGRVQILVGTGPRVRRDLGPGETAIAPDGRSLVFRSSTTGEVRVVRDRGRPDLILEPPGAPPVIPLAAAWPSPDTIVVDARSIVTVDVNSGRLTRLDAVWDDARVTASRDGGVVIAREGRGRYAADFAILTGLGR